MRPSRSELGVTYFGIAARTVNRIFCEVAEAKLDIASLPDSPLGREGKRMIKQVTVDGHLRVLNELLETTALKGEVTVFEGNLVPSNPLRRLTTTMDIDNGNGIRGFTFRLSPPRRLPAK